MFRNKRFIFPLIFFLSSIFNVGYYRHIKKNIEMDSAYIFHSFLFISIKNMSYVLLTFRHDRGFGFGISVWIVTLVLVRAARIWANSFCWVELWSKSVDWKQIRLMINTNLPFIDWTWRLSVWSSSFSSTSTSISTPHYLKQYISVVVCEFSAYFYGNLPFTILFRILVFWPHLFD
jgi:hypothetical protein